ncbi:MAG TPA: transglutaminase domain-containing protein [bacterium]|nr:transglutaminase domain-containing protein [bacterium]
MRKALVLAAVVAIVAGCGHAGPSGSGPVSAETWLSNTLQGQKVGYSMYRFNQLPEGYRFESFIKMTVAMGGKEQQVQSRSDANTAPDLTLKDFSFTFSSQNRSFTVKGRVAGSTLLVMAPGDTAERSIKLTGPVYPAAALGRVVVLRKFKKDSTYKVPVFDATVMGVNLAEVKVLGREKVTAGGHEYDALKFTTKLAKTDVTTWADDKGMAIVETSPPGIRSERTTADAVLKAEPEGAKFDVMTMFRVPVDTTIPEGANVSRLKLELSGVDPKEYDLTGPGQQVTSTSPYVVEIKTPDLPPGPVALPVTEQTDFLKPSITIQSDAPEVKAKLNEAIGKEKDGVAATRKLVSWVFTVVKKEPTASFPNALDVLKTMKGDCNEHAVLFAALARAAGIPTKTAVGLLYMNRAFYYHAWNEVYLGKWIPVDATFGECPASALHLKLAEGELSEQAEILGLVGKIGIKVKEFGLAPAK